MSVTKSNKVIPYEFVCPRCKTNPEIQHISDTGILLSDGTAIGAYYWECPQCHFRSIGVADVAFGCDTFDPKADSSRSWNRECYEYLLNKGENE